MKEPSVLDYLKSRLNPWKYDRLEVPDRSPGKSDAEILETSTAESSPVLPDATAIETDAKALAFPAETNMQFPWRSQLALILALIGQYGLSPAAVWDRKWGAVSIILAIGFLTWAIKQKELQPAPTAPVSSEVDPPNIRANYLIIGAILGVIAFISFGSLEFSVFNLLLLMITLWFFVQGLWISRKTFSNQEGQKYRRLHLPPWNINITTNSLVAIAAVGWVVFFRFYRLVDVPPEMNSDHAEKFIDVLRVLSGQTLIFFSSNGGREAIQFYLVAGLNRFFGLALNFLTLKLVTSAAGFLALPFLYLLGKELGSRRAGFLAFLFAGIAYWPTVVSRVGLRLPFYMLFTAALFYFLARGLRQTRRTDFILAGITLGLGFYGYSADRILPLLVVTAIGLYALHQPARNRRMFAYVSLLVVVIISLVIFLPLLRYLIVEPQGFFQRTFSRMGNWERPIEDPIPLVILKNTGRALAMFSADAGVVWPISIPNYPALSMISGALFYIGVGLILIRYITRRSWLDLMLLISIPILMLPSILSIAFPSENPNLYRTCGAVVPVFLLIGLALDGLMSSIEKGIRGKWGERSAIGVAVLLMLINSLQDYNLVFDRYYHNYLISSWNSSEMGRVARDFIDIYRVPDNVWVVGFPNWVDTRLVANNAGYPGKDYELKLENIPATKEHAGPKLFILNTQDTESLEALEQLYPEGKAERYPSKVDTKDFIIFDVFPENSNGS